VDRGQEAIPGEISRRVPTVWVEEKTARIFCRFEESVLPNSGDFASVGRSHELARWAPGQEMPGVPLKVTTPM